MQRPANAELQRRSYDELWRWLLEPDPADPENQNADIPGPDLAGPEQGMSAGVRRGSNERHPSQ